MICCCYKRPSLNLDEDDLKDIFSHQNTVVAGDLNAKGGETQTNNFGRTLLQFMNNNVLTIRAPDEATYIPFNTNGSESTLDGHHNLKKRAHIQRRDKKRPVIRPPTGKIPNQLPDKSRRRHHRNGI